MAGVVVVGSMWGDEGKGKVTDYLTYRNEVTDAAGSGGGYGLKEKLPIILHKKQMLYVVMLEETMQVIPLFMVVRNLL